MTHRGNPTSLAETERTAHRSPHVKVSSEGALRGEEESVTDGSPDHADTATDPDLCAIDSVLERNGCLTCHGTNADLSGGGSVHRRPDRGEPRRGDLSESRLLEAVLVNAEEPEASVLLHTVAADHYAGALDAECSPMAMPLGGTSTMSWIRGPHRAGFATWMHPRPPPM